jgi:hypothetical protein
MGIIQKGSHMSSSARPPTGRLARRLTVGRYFRERGLSHDLALKFYNPFGREVARLYTEVRGGSPDRYTRPYNRGPATGNSYAETDRSLFDKVWDALGMDEFIE